MTKVMDLTSLSKATVYRKVATGDFPAPFKIGKSRVAWLEPDIAELIKSSDLSEQSKRPAAQQSAKFRNQKIARQRLHHWTGKKFLSTAQNVMRNSACVNAEAVLLFDNERG